MPIDRIQILRARRAKKDRLERRRRLPPDPGLAFLNLPDPEPSDDDDDDFLRSTLDT